METKNIGLRDIEVADTKISDIDGEHGKLIYRGYDILDLTKNSTFEETAYLLLNDKLPTKTELDEFKQRLIDARDMPRQMQSNMRNWKKNADPMVMMQAFVVALSGYYDDKGANDQEINYQSAISLISKTPTIVASWERVRSSKDIVDPDPRLSHAGNFLNMLVGEKPDAGTERIFDICLYCTQTTPLMHPRLPPERWHQLVPTCTQQLALQLVHCPDHCTAVQTMR